MMEERIKQAKKQSAQTTLDKYRQHVMDNLFMLAFGPKDLSLSSFDSIITILACSKEKHQCHVKNYGEKIYGLSSLNDKIVQIISNKGGLKELSKRRGLNQSRKNKPGCNISQFKKTNPNIATRIIIR